MTHQSVAIPESSVRNREPGMADLSEREQRLAGLLGDGVFAIEALLLNSDSMLEEPDELATRDAIEIAHETLRIVQAELRRAQVYTKSLAKEGSQCPGSRTWGFFVG